MCIVVIMAVLKSDNANGLFGLAGPCQPPVVPMSTNELNCTVQRDRGTYDAVTVIWQITSVDLSFSVSQYFIRYTGRVSFSADQTVAVSRLNIYSFIHHINASKHKREIRKR